MDYKQIIRLGEQQKKKLAGIVTRDHVRGRL